MITCKDFHKFLEEFPDLGPAMDAKEEILAHVSECPKCRKTFEIHKEMVEKIKKTGQVAQPMYFAKAVMDEIKKPTPLPSGKLSQSSSLILAAGFSVAILLGGVLIVHNLPPSPQTIERKIPPQSLASGSAQPGQIGSSHNIATPTIPGSQGTSLDKTPE